MMNRTTQSNFISMLLKGIYYEGYIEGIGVACSSYIPVNSTTCPLPYDPFATRGTIWCHNIEKLMIRPLKVTDPIRPQIRNEELRNIYKKTFKPNFSPELRSWTEKLEQEAKKLITKKTAKLNKLQEEVNRISGSVSKTEKKIRKIVKLQEEIEELNEVFKEIEILSLSDQTYSLQISRTLSTSSTNQGALSFDEASRSILIILPPGASVGFFAHELKHAYQFEKGRLSLYLHPESRKIGGGRLYDKYDEMESFNRGKLFGEGKSIRNINQLPSDYNKIPAEERNINNYWGSNPNAPLTRERLQRIANSYNNILRYNGVTYFPQ